MASWACSIADLAMGAVWRCLMPKQAVFDVRCSQEASSRLGRHRRVFIHAGPEAAKGSAVADDVEEANSPLPEIFRSRAEAVLPAI